MKTLKAIMEDADRYQAIRESGEIGAAWTGTGFSLLSGGATEEQKKRLDDYTHKLALAFKGLENAKCVDKCAPPEPPPARVAPKFSLKGGC